MGIKRQDYVLLEDGRVGRVGEEVGGRLYVYEIPGDSSFRQELPSDAVWADAILISTFLDTFAWHVKHFWEKPRDPFADALRLKGLTADDPEQDKFHRWMAATNHIELSLPPWKELEGIFRFALRNLDDLNLQVLHYIAFRQPLLSERM